ncbi:type IV secretion protein Rhs [Kosakonia sp. ML.JS2a]|uniref:type IV secretion protein Rhs n=1 Tax=Kosakonia sp. ML.JS2a TaxID=2980557 RepID=UPI0021DA3DF1|nr:type IV secretion protein Rhs [Kosakonia sp. ML.JS2a]UXY11941.1 type IV secretion protein Rhs [Kosakonia sp. ML.JS2a]
MDIEIGEGKLRLMTPGEIAMARRVYGDSIVYSRVWVHCDSYFPFGLQKPGFAMAPNGELWFRKELYKDDFSVSDVYVQDKHTFIHELGHVWQHQHGQWVRMRGLFSWAANYYYRLDKETLTDYPLEQQASILADYWLILVYGMAEWQYQQQPNQQGKYRGEDDVRDIPRLYQKIVTGRG